MPSSCSDKCCKNPQAPEASAKHFLWSDSDADDEDEDVGILHGWSVPVRKASKPKQLKKVNQRVTAWSDQDMMKLEKLLTANADRHVAPPRALPGGKWTMLDSGSEPNVANCKELGRGQRTWSLCTDEGVAHAVPLQNMLVKTASE